MWVIAVVFGLDQIPLQMVWLSLHPILMIMVGGSVVLSTGEQAVRPIIIIIIPAMLCSSFLVYPFFFFLLYLSMAGSMGEREALIGSCNRFPDSTHLYVVRW